MLIILSQEQKTGEILKKILSQANNHILTTGFGTTESGYATLSKFWESLTNEGAKPPSWLNFPKTWIMLHNHSRAFQNHLLIILSHERKTGEIKKSRKKLTQKIRKVLLYLLSLSVCLSVCVLSTGHSFCRRKLIFGMRDP